MPDPDRKTVSASQVAALFDLSPYLTRFSLYHWLKNGIETDQPEDIRMTMGKRLEPVIVQLASEELGLIVEHNLVQEYARHPTCLIGATIDAKVTDPSRGLGIVECKNVDFFIHRDTWIGGKAPPHIELQLQAQMLVFDAKWGVIACLVGGNEMLYYPREPMPDLWQEMAEAAGQMERDVRAGNEPSPTGHATELDTINQILPQVKEATWLKNYDQDTSIMVAQYDHARSSRGFYEKIVKQIAPRLIHAIGDHNYLRTFGWEVKLNKSQVPAIIVKLPELDRVLLLEIAERELHGDDAHIVRRIADFAHTTRRESVRNLVTCHKCDDGPEPWGDDLTGAID